MYSPILSLAPSTQREAKPCEFPDVGGGGVVHGGQCVRCGQPEEAGEAVFQPVSDVPNLGCRRDASSRRQNPIPEKTDK